MPLIPLPQIAASSKKAAPPPVVPGPGYGFVSGNFYPTFSNIGSTFASVKGKIFFVMLTVKKPHKFTSVNLRVVTAHANTTLRMGVYSDSGSVKPLTLLHDWGTVSTATNGIKTITITWTPTVGRYWLCCVQQGSAATLISWISWSAINQWTILVMGSTVVPTTTSFGKYSWESTAATFTGSLPTPAPTLVLAAITPPAIVVKAA